MQIDVLTIFPELIQQYCEASVLGRAQQDGRFTLRTFDIREATTDRHRSVDAPPFGGGAGMVMKPEPIFATAEANSVTRPLLALTPAGRRFDQAMAQELAGLGGFSLLCGRYEGIDERVRRHLVDGEVSIGDVVLAGGELGALIVIEAVCRLLPGVLGNDQSATDESFSEGLLEYPQYTRPAEFRGWSVPPVLVGGDHGRIARWRRAQSLAVTLERRPDLIAARGGLTDEERDALAEFGLVEIDDGGSSLP